MICRSQQLFLIGSRFKNVLGREKSLGDFFRLCIGSFGTMAERQEDEFDEDGDYCPEFQYGLVIDIDGNFLVTMPCFPCSAI